VLILGLAVTVVNRLALLARPGTTKFLIDDVMSAGKTHLLWPLIGVVVASLLVQAASTVLLKILLSIPAQQLVTDLSIEVQSHLGRLPVRFFDANKTGKLVSRVMSDVEDVQKLIGGGLVQFIGGAVTALAAIGVLIWFDPLMTLIVFAFLPPYWLISQKAFQRSRTTFKERSRLRAEVMGRLTESFNGIRIVKGFHAEQREAEIFRDGVLGLFENYKAALKANSSMTMFSTLIQGLVSIPVMILGAYQISSGKLSVGEFVSYTLFLSYVVAPMTQVVELGLDWSKAAASLDRVREVMEETPEDADPARTVTVDDMKGHVVFKNVSFEYEPGNPVLRDITLEASPGTVTALAGPSGAGKSTLVGLVAAFHQPLSGTIYVDGSDLSTLRLDSYRSQLGLVLQDNFVFDGTIRDNIRFGRPNASDAAIDHAARLAHVDEFALQWKSGYETTIGERGVKLSGGQRQRVAIARAILADPRILILDEATSSLDIETEAYIQEGLAALMRGRTTFVIAHRLSTIQQADQILFFERGEIVERGHHEELLARRGRYHDVYTRQLHAQANRFVNPGEKNSDETDYAESKNVVRR